MQPLLLAMDAGQTEVKVRFAGRSLSLPGIRADLSLMTQLADVATRVTALGDGSPVELAVGAAALPRATMQDARAVLDQCRPAGVQRVSLAPDSVTSYLGALGEHHGVVSAVGTGAVTLGVGPDTVARVDGWGHGLGDAGSGHWIGREAVDAALRALDGRGPATALTAVVDRLFPQLHEAYVHLLAHPDKVRLIASLTPAVVEAASSDEVADRILKRAGEEVALSVATAVCRIGQDRHANPRICLVGGVVRHGPVRSACVTALRAHWPQLVPEVARGDALAGAALLAGLGADHPLSAHVAVAS